ncbi:uncharacterized protein LOC129718292 [Wyeomyia smithii]|uniref:uncharacterized protein LOC129718292 n=1 Tax=Wyeomyia smithii TaxID=174621 RepID=UPI0024680876|nr:uncharacterized protein LOC129718292 [Wyeomyia smithii]XP_055524902.1 uncharacterized protein LOC129718292 [Wyeomyia smithii]XP_055524904.1 uncharacterized protein LOC129718292 [Wyeomyia smithii]
MGPIKHQLIVIIVLVCKITKIDTENSIFLYYDNDSKNTTENAFGDKIPSSARNVDGSTNLHTDTVNQLNKQDVTNSSPSNESAIFTRYQRSTGSNSGRTGSQSLCSKQGCSCLDQPILTIDCELLDSETTLSNQYYIPREAKSLDLRLKARGARLMIDSELFVNSLLNHVLIMGDADGSNALRHVEFQNKAFCLNNGTYPELEVYNIYTVVFHERTFCQEFKLNVTNAGEVIIMPGAFSVPESEILLNNVKDIRIQEDAFKGSRSTKLDITNSGIKILSELRASFRQIQFVNTTIEQISTKAFDVTKIDSLIFENCEIDRLMSQAITEKLLCRYFTMTRCRIKEIETNFIADSGLNNFNMHSNVINDIADDAIKFTGISSQIINNKIIKTGKNWFVQKPGWTNVVITNNSFGEFNYFTIERSSSSKVCQFHANSITKPASRSFSFTQHPTCTISEISFNKLCTCDETWLKELLFKDYDKLLRESYCRIDETLKYCFNATIFNEKMYIQQVCDESTRTIDCSRSQKEKKVVPHFVSPNEIELIQYNDYYYYILIGIPIVIVCIVISLSVVFCKVCRRESNSSADIVSNDSFTMTQKPSKSFTKEDKLIIHQTLQKIKEKQAPEMYEEILTYSRKLMEGTSTETEKVLTIGEIVRRLNDCENSGDDFVAFTDILYRHLAPSTNNTPLETVYAEPSVPVDGTTVIETPATSDHIYAELTSAAQPLLVNEYSAPMDLNDSHYSEPVQIILKDNTRTLITPYAIGNNISSIVQQPTTSRNLPDILNSKSSNSTSSSNSSTTANVIIGLESLRYVDRSPTTTSREIPEYSLPIKKVPPKPALRQEQTVDFETSTSNSDHSEHSGGSDITVKIDDIVEYVDA